MLISKGVTPFFLQILCVFLVMVTVVAMPSQAYANKKYASIVVDAATGKVLRSRNANKSLHPASLTKMMTLYMAFDALNRGQIKLTDRVRMSKRAASMVPSKIGLPVGASIKVEDAIYALVTKSANDVAVALGEKIAGSEWAFARKMTAKARSLGMRKTRFMNASGLHHKKQVSTARDMAILGRALVYKQSRYYHYFSTRNFKYRGAKYRNHNRLMSNYKGMDGIKTGYIHASGFNLVASAVRNDRRLVAVVFGGKTSGSRNKHMAKIMDEGFRLARKLPKVRVASMHTPTPKKKPNFATVLAAASKGRPSTYRSRKAGMDHADDIIRKNARPLDIVVARNANANPMEEMLGQGDFDSQAAKRLETSLMSVAMHTRRAVSVEGVGAYSYNHGDDVIASVGRALGGDSWAIQIGAYSSAKISKQAIGVAAKSLPREMREALKPRTVPLVTGSRTIYRARIEGFDENTAQQACAYLRNCMVIAP